MEYLVDALTRAPSQVLVKSATQFGEEAAKVLGVCVEESLKSCTDDITKSIKKNLKQTGKLLSKELDKFSAVFKETAVEGFTEWGIGIERAFYHLGHKLENGLNNTANRLAGQLDESIENNLSKIDLTVRDSVDVFSKTFLKDQVPHWRASFLRELNILMICLSVVSFGIFILCMSWAFGGYQIIVHLLTKEFSTLCFLLFAVINGIAMYIWNKSLVVNERVDSNTPVDDVTTPNTKWMKNIISEQQLYYKKNPQLMLIFVGCLSFLMGHLGRDVFSFNSLLTPSSGVVMQALAHATSWFHILIILLLMIAITLIINKVLLFQLTLKVYTFWKEWLKFREFTKTSTVDTSLEEDLKEIVIKRVSSVKSVKSVGVGNEDDNERITPVRLSSNNLTIPKLSQKSISSSNILAPSKHEDQPIIPILPIRKALSGEQLETFEDSGSDSDESNSARAVSDIGISSTPEFILSASKTDLAFLNNSPTLHSLK